MKRYMAWMLALIFYISVLPWNMAVATDYFNFNARNLVVKESPYVDVRAYGFGADNTAAQNKTAILAAQASLSPHGGTVKFPKGSFNVAADIAPTVKGVTFEGAAPAFTYGTDTMATNLTFGAGSYGFDLISQESTGYYITIKNLVIDGNNVLTNGIGIKATHFIQDVLVKNCVAIGIHISDLANTTSLNRVGAHNNGVGIQSDGIDSTIIHFDEVTIRQNVVGLKHYAGIIFSRNLLIEANTGVGLEIHQAAGTSGPSGKYENTWMEGNGTTSDYQLTMTAAVPGVPTSPSEMQFNNMRMTLVSGHHNGIHIVNGAHIDFNNLSQGAADNGIVLESGAYYVVVKDSPNTGTIVNNGSTGYYREKKLTSGELGKSFSGSVSADQGLFTKRTVIGKTSIEKGIATDNITGATPIKVYSTNDKVSFIVVYIGGAATSGGSHQFLDCVTFFPGNTPVAAFSTTLYGTPAARTYTSDADGLYLVMTSGAYNVTLSAQEISQ